MDKLLPCPFCGAPGRLSLSTRKDGWCAECSVCNANLFFDDSLSPTYETEESAIAEWNKRAPPIPKTEVGTDPSREKKSQWISFYGSRHLFLAFEAGFSCQERYIEERSRHEFPSLKPVLYEKDKIQWRDVSFPSEKALKALSEMRKTHPEATIIYFYFEDTKASLIREAVAITNYLEKYVLIDEVD